MLRVTQAIKLCGLIDAAWSDQYAMDRGTAIHEATALDDKGDLDESTVDPAVKPYLDGWRLFRREMEPQFLTIEEKVRNEPMGYEGTLDRRIILASRECIVDLKTGIPADWHSLQLALYAMCFDRPLARFGIYVSDDGKYKFIEYKDRKDYDVAKSVLTVAHWKVRNA